MSLWFMNDNHTFVRLDTLPTVEAMDKLEQLVDAQGGYGFVGTKDVTPSASLQWQPGEAWRERVMVLLLKSSGVPHD